MNSWSNIEFSPDDPEITELDKIEKSFGDLRAEIRQIRELITRFEICHFKCQQHLKKIKESISALQPGVEPGIIGAKHIHKGENAWKNDSTGRSLMGQKYLSALANWLLKSQQKNDLFIYDQELYQQVKKWLGRKNPEKERLIRLLIARLKWDWKSYEELKKGGRYQELELQVCSMDICHYAFPGNLNLLLKSIGKLKPVKAIEGCGSCDEGTKKFIEKECLILNDLLKTMVSEREPVKDNLIKEWLIACLLKTMKEQTRMKIILCLRSENQIIPKD